MTSWRLTAARGTLAWESLWPALWPAVGIGLAFLVVAAFDLLPALPGWAHRLVLGLLACALAASLIHAARRFSLPDGRAARRRLEQDNALAHRPIQALDDRLATNPHDPFAQALWTAHRRRMARSIRQLRLGWPRAGWVTSDPFGLRAALGILLLIGVMTAGADFWPRVGRALHPANESGGIAAGIGYDLWITPPDYTGLPPTYLGSAMSDSGDKPIGVPAGSTVLARVHGGSGVPELALDGTATRLDALATGEFSATMPVGAAHKLTVVQDGSTLARYALTIIPDQPPAASWNGGVQVTPRGALRLGYAAKDDYGIKSLSLSVQRPGDPAHATNVDVPVAGAGREKDIKATTFQDLTSSRWAGMPVELRLTATDAIGQTGISDALKLTLPEHVFHNPIAKALIDQRKMLMKDPSQADAAAETISDLSDRPALFRDDLTVFLALRHASARLTRDKDPAATDSVIALLWDTALRIDDGDVPEAQKSLRQAEQALQDALDRNASNAEIEALMKQLQQAVDRYLQAMASNPSQGQEPPPPGGQENAITQNDIQKMLDQARKMAQTGARDAAKQALSNLQDLLESLHAGRPAGQKNGPGDKAMRAMQGLAQKQQQLLDKSYRAAQRDRDGNQAGSDRQGQSGQPRNGDGPNGDLAGAQEGLRRQLREAMKQLGQSGGVPQAVERAERSMQGAEEALKRGEPGDAVGPQGQALDQLQQAMKELGEKMGQGEGEGTPQQAGRDPLGRNGTGQVDSGDVKLPTGAEMGQSREILDELRRRASDWARPMLERDYIDRLLERF